MNTFKQKVIALAVGTFLTTTAVVNGNILYQNTTADAGSSLNFTNGWQIGNQIILGGGANFAAITNFSFEIYSTLAAFTGSGVQMQVFLYANNGSAFNGFATPGSILYDSGLFPLLTPQQYSGINAVTLDFDLALTPVNVNSNFTFAVMVTNLAPTDLVGMEYFTNTTVGANYGDYWLNSGGGWELRTNSVIGGFGAQFEGVATPEPSILSLGVIGASLLMGSVWLRRRQLQPKQD